MNCMFSCILLGIAMSGRRCSSPNILTSLCYVHLLRLKLMQIRHLRGWLFSTWTGITSPLPKSARGAAVQAPWYLPYLRSTDRVHPNLCHNRASA